MVEIPLTSPITRQETVDRIGHRTGHQIAFTSDRDGNFRNLRTINADGTNPINLTNHLAEDNRSSWSPDGTQIAFDSNRDSILGRMPNWEIYVMNADGTNPINLTNNPCMGLIVLRGVPSLTSKRCLKRKIGNLMGKSQAQQIPTVAR